MNLKEINKIKDKKSKLLNSIAYYSNKLRETTNYIKYDKIEDKINELKKDLEKF